jgi:predicted enzyme related to lactoylglutathione lyase
MKKALLILIIALASFGLGYTAKHAEEKAPKKVTGVGGIFFKCKDPKAVKAWYAKHLGLNMDEYGTAFVSRYEQDSTRRAILQWGAFKETTKYFLPSTKEFMINYRVENLDWLVKELKKEGVTICDSMDVQPYGKFIHIMDMEGNKIELWEPIDWQTDWAKGKTW